MAKKLLNPKNNHQNLLKKSWSNLHQNQLQKPMQKQEKFDINRNALKITITYTSSSPNTPVSTKNDKTGKLSQFDIYQTTSKTPTFTVNQLLA